MQQHVEARQRVACELAADLAADGVEPLADRLDASYQFARFLKQRPRLPTGFFEVGDQARNPLRILGTGKAADRRNRFRHLLERFAGLGGSDFEPGQRIAETLDVVGAEQRIGAFGQLLDLHKRRREFITSRIEGRRPKRDPRYLAFTFGQRLAVLAAVRQLDECQTRDTLHLDLGRGGRGNRQPVLDTHLHENQARVVRIDRDLLDLARPYATKPHLRLGGQAADAALRNEL